MTSIEETLVKLLGAAGILLMLAVGGYWKGYEAGKESIVAEWVKEKQQYQDKLQKAEAQHDKDQKTVDDLHADVERVRIHLPACPAAAQGSDKAAGVFSSRMDEGFARLQERAAVLFRECDQINIDAARAQVK